MQRLFATTFPRYVLCIFLALSLVSCQEPEPAQKKTRPAKSYTGSEYVQQLAMSQLTATVSKESVDIVNGYSSQKPESERLGIVVLTYEAKDSGAKRKVAAPVSLAKDHNDYENLRKILNQLVNNGDTLQDWQVKTISLSPNKHFVIDDKSSAETTISALNAQEQQIISRAHHLPTLQAARLELNLIRFCMHHRFRDAAYIATENVKQILATATVNNESESLVKELESLESELRETLPYKL